MNEIQKLKILVCEADIRVLSRLESWILAINHDVIITSDGIAALEIFKNEYPDIVLLSQELKNMGGLELLSSIKKIVPNQATILMMGDSDISIFRHAIELQVDKYLNKPIEAKQLFQAVDSLSEEKIWHKEFRIQQKVLQEYKDAIDLSFSVSKHDIDGNIMYVNDLFCVTTKLQHSDAMAGVINPLNNPNTDMSSVWNDLKNQFIYRGRQIFKSFDDKEHIIDITAVALRDEEDKVYEYLVFSDDVSEIIYAARKIKDQELDNRLEKLNHARELNKVKDSFLTLFTHELKTPLNAIINFSEYVGKHLAKEDFKKRDRLLSQVEEINKSGYFMLNMISNLMDAIKFRDLKIELKIEKINITDIIKNAIIYNKKNIYDVEVIFETTEDMMIFSDAQYFLSICNHLLSNAIKYAKSTVKIRVLKEKDECNIIIEDDGIGFSNTEHVFDLFEQDDSDSLTRNATGIGVGLYIVKQLCDRMSYNLELLSSKELGGAKVLLKVKTDIR
jgi:signal transduction histidine kinase/CheY-like chemotaxis protein